MNSKQFAATIGAAVLLAGCGPDEQKKSTDHTSKKDSITKQNDKNLHDTLSHNTAEYYDSSVATHYSIKDLIKQKNPLVTISKRFNLGHVLGKLDVNEIIRVYNPTLAATKPANFDRTRVNLKSLDTLIIPHIFPSMKDFFSPSLETFLADKPEIANGVGDKKTIIIVAQRPDGKLGLGYYNNGVLEVAGPVSIGDGNRHNDKKNGKRFHARSPQGSFQVLRKHEAHRSSTQRDAMPNYMEVDSTRGLGMHGGQYVDGTPHSHGCYRFVHMLSNILFERIHSSKVLGEGTAFLANWKPFQKELDSVDYYKKRPWLAKPWLAKQDTIPNPNPHTNKIKQHFQKELYRDSLNSIKQKASKQTYNNLKGRKK